MRLPASWHAQFHPPSCSRSCKHLKLKAGQGTMDANTTTMNDTIRHLSRHPVACEGTVEAHATCQGAGPAVLAGSAAVAAGATPWTRSARLPLLALFASALLAERCLPAQLHSLLQAGDHGQVRRLYDQSASSVQLCSSQLHSAAVETRCSASLQVQYGLHALI